MTITKAAHTVRPKKLTTKQWRQTARRMRDEQWHFAERVAEHGVVWFCWWDKAGRHKGKEDRPDLYVTGLIDGMEMLEWMRSHRDWWRIGKWSDEQYAAPIRLKPAGRIALRNRNLYDMEPVTGGMVEPGWQCVPFPRTAAEARANG